MIRLDRRVDEFDLFEEDLERRAPICVPIEQQYHDVTQLLRVVSAEGRHVKARGGDQLEEGLHAADQPALRVDHLHPR